MSEADEAALNAEWAALNACCAANPRDAAQFAATLRHAPHAEKENWLVNSTIHNYAALVRLLLADGLSPNSVNPEDDDTTAHGRPTRIDRCAAPLAGSWC